METTSDSQSTNTNGMPAIPSPSTPSTPSTPTAPAGTPAAPPTPAPTAPTAPSVPPAAATQPTSQPQPTPQPKTKQEWFQHLIKMATPPQNVVTTNPDGTQTVANKATPVSMAQLLVTGTLAGLMAKNTYREGAYGPIFDRQATSADAYAAGTKVGQDWAQGPQKMSDDMMARKLSTVAANVQAAHGYAAMTQAQFAAQKEGTEAEAAQDAIWQKTADLNKSTTLASADEYDKNRQTGDPSAYLTRGLTWDELMSSPFKSNMTSQLMVQDGLRPQYDEHLGRTKMVPTYSVLNPAVKVKLNEDTVARIAKFNSTFGNDLFKATNGNVQLGLNQLAMLTHQGSSIMHAEATLQSLSDSKDDLASKLGITGNIEDRLAAASRDNSSVWKSLSEFENGQAHGGNTADQLQRILQSDGGDAIFKALGTDRDKVQKFITDYNARITATNKLAQEGGMGEKAPGAPAQINGLVDSLKPSTYIDGDDSKALMADVPTPDKDGVIHMTQGQIEKLTARRDSVVASNKSIAEKNALANGDPVQMQKTASNTIEGDPNDITKIASMRGNARNNAVNAIHDEAAQRGLDTTQYGEAALEAKSNMWKDYAGGQKTPTGKQLVSFDNYLGHSAALLDAQDRLKEKTLGLTHTPVLNMTLKEIGNQLTDDKDWAAYSAALEPVKHEIENFLAAGYATKSEDVANMNALLSDKLPINQASSVIRQLADTADVRLAGLGKAYVNTMGTTYPHLMSTDSQNALKRMGIQSKALPYTQALPRGWVNHEATQMTDKNMARAYFQAAGSDRNAAIALAKNNGWLLQ
jgi:hypothetical protein